MAVEIKSGSSSDLQTVDPTSKAARVTLYNSSGVEGTKEIPVEIICAPVTVENNDIISSIDVSEYKAISLQLTGVWEGVVTFQGSNDNGTFYNIVAQDATSLTNPFSATETVNGLYNVPIVYKYFRARVTTYTSGTFNCTAYGHKEDKSLNSVGQIGVVTLAAETTKVIGTVNVAAGNTYTSGTITASDTALPAAQYDGTLLSGTPSVNSYFASQGNAAFSTWVVEITGTVGGTTFYFEGSTGSTDGINGNWVALTALQRGDETSTLTHRANATGSFTGNATGLSYLRVRAVGGVGVSVAVGLNFSRGAVAVNFNSPLPSGTNVIGSVRALAASADPLLTDFYVGVGGAINGNSRVIRGQASTLRSLVMSNYTAGGRHVKIYDSASTPTAGQGVPVLVVSLAASGTIAFPLPAEGLSFTNGIAMTMTLGPANDNVVATATAPDFSLVSIFT